MSFLFPKKNDGIIRAGFVSGYDPDTRAAVITPSDDLSILQNVSCPVDNYDSDTGAIKYTPPSTKVPCLFTEINGQKYLIRLYTAPNVSEKGNTSTEAPAYGSTINYAPSDTASLNAHIDGTTMTNGNGGQESMSASQKIIEMCSKKLSTTWSMINYTYETICNIFRLHASSVDVNAESTSAGKCDTLISFKSFVGQKPGAVFFDIGNHANVFTVMINGKELLHVDGDRNVIIHTKSIQVINEKLIDTRTDTEYLQANTSAKLATPTNTIEVNTMSTTCTGKYTVTAGDADFSASTKMELP